MIEASFHKYIKNSILKSGEELEWDSPNYGISLLEAKIIKRTERTYRVHGFLILSIQSSKAIDWINDTKLDNLNFTPKKKIILDDDDRQTFRWLEEGWILKEVRFEKDEKTVRSSHYRMGFRLYQYEQLKLQQKMDQTFNDLSQIKNHILTILSNQVVNYYNFSNHRKLAIHNIMKIVSQLNQVELSSSNYFPQKWQLGKRLKYLHFVNAFSQLLLQKEEYDWKEIGAAYFKKIGGSKEFDPYKQEFIDHIEEWTNVPVSELGLTSLGQITSVYFAGELTGKFAAYNWGPVHALTNLSIAIEKYQTKATTLWLVENRAVLTRMAASNQFLQDTNSLIICVDGHLRSGHKNAILQIMDNSAIEQVIIWCDYDLDGLQISKEVYSIIYKYNNVRIKLILPEQQVIKNWYKYEQYLMNFLENNKMEQEQMMGGANHWKKWIRD